MICSIIFYLIFVALTIIGARYSAGSFQEKVLDKESSASLRGLMALGVILHHISQKEAFSDAGELSFFVDIGFLFVGVFFFLSGLGLARSLESKPGYLDSFFRKRFLSIAVPFYVMTIIYFGLNFLMHKDIPLAKRLLSLTGITLANEQSWYVIVQATMYISFFAAFRSTKTRTKSYAIILAVILLEAALFLIGGHMFWWIRIDGSYWWITNKWDTVHWSWKPVCWWFQGEWWVNSTITFLIGLVLGFNEKAIIQYLKKIYWIKTAAFLVMAVAAHLIWVKFLGSLNISYWTEFDSGKPGIDNKFITWTIQTVEVTCSALFIYMISMKFKTENAVTRFFGSHSLELYLMQAIALFGWEFLLTEGKSTAMERCLYAFLVIASTTLMAVIFKLICRILLKKAK